MRKQLLILTAGLAIATTASAQMKVGTNPTTLASDTTNFQVEGTDTTKQFVVLKNGNVGIGTANPQTQLNINTGGILQVGLNTDPFFTKLTTNVLDFNRPGNFSHVRQKGLGGGLRFYVFDGADKLVMTMHNNQNVSIGASADSALSKLRVSGYVALGSTDVTADALSSASDREGMVRYTATNGLQYHDNTNWVSLLPSTYVTDVSVDAWVNDAANTDVRLATLSDNTTIRSTNANVIIKDDGKVGIGTNSPVGKLTVAGNLNLLLAPSAQRPLAFDTNYASSFYLTGTGGTVGYPFTTSGNLVIQPYNDNNVGRDVVFVTGTDVTDLGVAMNITQSKRVGIGTTDPKSKLHVVGLPTGATQPAGLTAGAFWVTQGHATLPDGVVMSAL